MEDNKTYIRQLDIVTPEQLRFPIIIIGAGGIGSWSTLALAKMGCSDITVVDYDRVEVKNTPSQIYNLKQIGKYKVEALQETVKTLTGTSIKIVPMKFQDWYNPQVSEQVIVSGVDSLEERVIVFNKITDHLTNLNLYIDVRMAAELIRILSFTPLINSSLENYSSKLSKNSKAHKEACTGRSVVYNTFICGGLVASLVKKYAKKESVPTNVAFDITNLQTF